MMKSSRLLNLYKLRGVYYLCTVKTKINTPLMYGNYSTFIIAE